MKKSFLLLLILNIQICHAIKIHDKFGDWQLFSTKKNSEIICYIVSQPTNNINDISYKKRYLIISKLDNNQYEINISVRDKIYNGKISLFIDDQFINLLAKENLAWTENPDEDNFLVEKMKFQDKLQIIWRIIENERQIDEYSLKDLTKALKEMDVICK